MKLIFKYIKWLWFYFLLLKDFRKFNQFTILFEVGSRTANYYFKFKHLKDSPKISFWYPYEEDVIIFYTVTKKCGPYYNEIYSIQDDIKPKDMIEYLNSFIPNFINNYDTLHSDDRDVMEMNIDNMIKGIKRKNKIDSIIL